MEDNSKKYYKKYCLVPLCKSTSVKTPNKLFIRLPFDFNRRTRWLKACGIENISPKSDALHVCEDHFNLEEDMENYLKFKLMGGKKIIKSGVVPHIFDCLPDKKRASAHSERITAIKRVRRQLVQEDVASTSMVQDVASTLTVQDVASTSTSLKLLEEQKNPSIELNMIDNYNQRKEVSTQTLKQVFTKFRSKGVQCKLYTGVSVSLSPHRVSSKDIGTSPGFKGISQLQKSDSKSSTTSSSGSYIQGKCDEHDKKYISESGSSSEQEKVNEFKSSSLRSTILRIEKRPRIYLGLPEHAYYILQLLQKYCSLPNTHIFLTLKKIRTGHAFILLGDDFGISESYSSKIFTKSLPIISKYLRKCIFSPNINTVKLNLPLAFRARYSNVLCIVDCLEIEIEKPSDAIKQSFTWSEYKKCNTLKYLISCTPDGLINFISTGYGGRASDATIVEHSGFLNMLPPNVSIMADRGFKHIEHLLVRKNCKLIRPPSVSSNVKSTKAEVLETKRIASLRIHVERVIRRIKEFAFLAPHACIDNKLIPHTDHIIKIVCGLINLQSGVISGK